jgi:hypothetical protein
VVLNKVPDSWHAGYSITFLTHLLIFQLVVYIHVYKTRNEVKTIKKRNITHTHTHTHTHMFPSIDSWIQFWSVIVANLTDINFAINLAKKLHPSTLPLWTHSGACFKRVSQIMQSNYRRKGIWRGTFVRLFIHPSELQRILSESHDKTIQLLLHNIGTRCW